MDTPSLVGTPMASGIPWADANASRRESQDRKRRIFEHAQRCRAAGRPSEAEVSRIVAEYFAAGGVVRDCGVAFALPVQNGAGRDVAQWFAAT